MATPDICARVTAEKKLLFWVETYKEGTQLHADVVAVME
jgi:hypothetical protein